MTKKRTAMSLLFGIIALALIIAGGFIGYSRMHADQTADPGLPHIRLKPEIVAFASRLWPEAHQRLLELNGEITLIDQEIERLNGMEKDFPQQKKIIQEEKTIWDRTSKSLHSVLDNFEKEVETVYVTYSVNKEKGSQSIKDSQETILKPVAEALSESGKLTERLKTEPEKNWFSRIKKILNK